MLLDCFLPCSEGGNILKANQKYFYLWGLESWFLLPTSECNSSAKSVSKARSWNAKKWWKEGRNKILLLACCITVYREVLLPLLVTACCWSLHVNLEDCEPCLPSCWPGWNRVLQWSQSGKTVQRWRGSSWKSFSKDAQKKSAAGWLTRSL